MWALWYSVGPATEKFQDFFHCKELEQEWSQYVQQWLMEGASKQQGLVILLRPTSGFFSELEYIEILNIWKAKKKGKQGAIYLTHESIWKSCSLIVLQKYVGLLLQDEIMLYSNVIDFVANSILSDKRCPSFIKYHNVASDIVPSQRLLWGLGWPESLSSVQVAW